MIELVDPVIRIVGATVQGVQGCTQDVCSAPNLPNVSAGQNQITAALQIVFGIIGAVALIYIILGAFQLTTSLGNPEALAKARQTVIFAAVGLGIALSAELIVSFVLSKL